MVSTDQKSSKSGDLSLPAVITKVICERADAVVSKKYLDWDFVQDHSIIVRGEGPTTQQYKLSYLLSGPVP